ncbi:hypothetical protein EYC98_08735 [Halieaceae bacterium IMCC14734]|uniref:Class I SAM-dependent methyltransferase n=1 Tax=Candidatus Litorirhabdus singularis TaxID=2518993 RepID=A0ABT3TF52_9GAMM|nr:hypothetical protein [Candidatus Litorirhabdus singularis]MCX2980948.1 hypothetical protein [Candidatus Litorirhabdus singularis]
MDNLFITKLMDWAPTVSRKARFTNRVLSLLGLSARLVDPMGTGRMSNVEQRMNLFHLCSQVLAYKVPGQIVELGSYTGSTSILLSKIVQQMDPDREIHLYDAWVREDFLKRLIQNFDNATLPRPHLYRGWIQETVAAHLPDQICFAHIDLGSRISPDQTSLIEYALDQVYPRMSPGAICVIQEYSDEVLTPLGKQHHRPGLKAGVKKFLADKPENIAPLYAGNFRVYAHGYFRKL